MITITQAEFDKWTAKIAQLEAELTTARAAYEQHVATMDELLAGAWDRRHRLAYRVRTLEKKILDIDQSLNNCIVAQEDPAPAADSPLAA